MRKAYVSFLAAALVVGLAGCRDDTDVPFPDAGVPDGGAPVRVNPTAYAFTGLGGSALPLLANTSVVGLAVGDLDRDGQPDVALIDGAGATFDWFHLSDAGELTPQPTTPLGCATDTAVGLRLGPVRAPGSLDAVTQCGAATGAASSAQLVAILAPPVPSPSASPGALVVVTTPLTSGLGAGPFDVGDFDGDGVLDVVAAPGGDGATTTVTPLFGDGSGHFIAAATMPAGTDSAPDHLAVGDANGDGIPDVFTLLADESGAVLLGSRSSPTPHAYGTTPLVLDGADTAGAALFAPLLTTSRSDLLLIDGGGGETDVAVSLHVSPTPSTLPNANALFTNPVSYYLDPGPQSACTGDFDGDGFVDLAVGTYDNDADTEVIDLLFNDGLGHFAYHQKLAVSILPSVCATGDFNGDGRADLVVGSNIPGQGFVVYLSNKTP